MIKHFKIKDFSKVITGGTPSTSKNEYWDGGNIPWLNSGELNQDIIISTRNYITQAGLKNSSTRLMPPNTILIALTGSTTGVVGFLTFEACANQSVTGILPSKFHEPKYLYYYLKSIRKQVISDAYGGAQPHISQAYVKDIQIPLPPLPTQQKIASILDAADTLRQKDKALLAKYDELTQALFLDMFGDPVSNPKGWELLNIRKHSEKFCDGPFGSNLKTEHYREKGVRVIRLNNIGVGKFINQDKAYVSLEHAKVLSNNICVSGDILIGTMGEPNLRACILPSYVETAINKADCLICRPNKKFFNSNYLCYLLNNNRFVESLSDLVLGQTRGRISMGRLSTREVIAPPIDLQIQFSKRVEIIEQQKSLAQASLEKSEELFNSLLQKAFKGELV